MERERMEKSKRGGESELRDGTMMLYVSTIGPRRVPALAWPGCMEADNSFLEVEA
jgi:hypothetical protein